MKRFIYLSIITILLTACSKKVAEVDLPVKAAEPPKITVSPSPSPSPTPPPKEPEFINPLTGLETSEELSKMRPFAIVVNNLKKALPQSGLMQADVFYEVLAEGGITRLVCVGQNYTSEKIGPIRSARDYFIDFALDNEAVFVHHGGSPGAYSFINKNNIDDIDGMALDGVTFFRDNQRILERGLEHSSYVISDKIRESMANYGITPTLSENYQPMFNFYKEDDDLELEDAKIAEKITLPYSDYQNSYFVYSPAKKEYERYQNNEMHLDEAENKQISVKNVIVQFADMEIIDNEGRMKVGLIGEGTGYYFSNGKYIPIKWKKDGHFEQTKWYNKNGELLSINKGKTWINVFDSKLEIFAN